MCDVCGRTLLRGERAEIYLSGADRRSVCELCKSRAVNEGWVREGTVPAYDGAGTASDRRRSLLGRLRSRRDPAVGGPADGLDGGAAPRPVGPAWPDTSGRTRDALREPRHVRAVPTSDEQKIASAIDLFNSSEHRRTIAGVARSLGEPSVTVIPSGERASLVNVIVAWELCWYRYEVDLSDDQPSVRVAGQGYELTELDEHERLPNATADEHGSLVL
jgi:hypothetical protein